MEKGHKSHTECAEDIKAISDSMYVLSGKWKIIILTVLRFGDKRFGEIKKEIPKITERMLSKELRELEANQLVKRTVFDSVPVVIEYSLTPYGYSLDKILVEMRTWGIKHRKRIMQA
jgi:DNA-binding HxlR family transcriptional regulator